MKNYIWERVLCYVLTVVLSYDFVLYFPLLQFNHIIYEFLVFIFQLCFYYFYCFSVSTIGTKGGRGGGVPKGTKGAFKAQLEPVDSPPPPHIGIELNVMKLIFSNFRIL